MSRPLLTGGTSFSEGGGAGWKNGENWPASSLGHTTSTWRVDGSSRRSSPSRSSMMNMDSDPTSYGAWVLDRASSQCVSIGDGGASSNTSSRPMDMRPLGHHQSPCPGRRSHAISAAAEYGRALGQPTAAAAREPRQQPFWDDTSSGRCPSSSKVAKAYYNANPNRQPIPLGMSSEIATKFKNKNQTVKGGYTSNNLKEAMSGKPKAMVATADGLFTTTEVCAVDEFATTSTRGRGRGFFGAAHGAASGRGAPSNRGRGKPPQDPSYGTPQLDLLLLRTMRDQDRICCKETYLHLSQLSLLPSKITLKCSQNTLKHAKTVIQPSVYR